MLPQKSSWAETKLITAGSNAELRESISSETLNVRSFRNRRFTLAVIGSLAAKGCAFGTQVLAIPFAIHFCGLPTYTLYLSLVAASLAPSMVLLRLGPRFVSEIAVMRQRGDEDGIAAHFRKSVVVTTVNCLLATVVVAALLSTQGFRSLFEGVGTESQVTLPLLALAVMSIVGGFIMTIEAVQSGLHETHILNARAAVANVLSCVLLCVAIPLYPSLWMLILVLQGVPLLTRVLNTIVFVWRYRSLVLLQSGRPAHILGDALKFTFTAGFCAYFATQAPLLLITTQVSDPSIAGMSAISIQIALQLLGLSMVLLAPCVPAMADAFAASDLEAVNQYRTCLKKSISTVALLSVIGGAIGGGLLSSKMGLSITVGAILMGSAGMLFAALVFEKLFFTILLTLAQPEKLSLVYAIVGVKSVAVFLGALLCVSVGYELFAIFAMSAIGFAIAVVPLRYFVDERFQFVGCIRE